MYLKINESELLDKSYDYERWFVLYTKPNFEKIIDKNLKELGLKSYLPLQKELRQWKDRKVWIETPLFRSYIFIKTNLKKKDKAFKVNGILNYVRFNSQLAIIREEEIERIKQLSLYDGKVKIEFENPEIGKKVQICEGTLKGLIGFLTGVNDNKKVRVYIDSLNCFAVVSLDINSVAFKYIS